MTLTHYKEKLHFFQKKNQEILDILDRTHNSVDTINNELSELLLVIVLSILAFCLPTHAEQGALMSKSVN